MTGAPEWKPRSVRYGLAPEPALVEGVPGHLSKVLSDWFKDHLARDAQPGEVPNPDANAQRIALELRVPGAGGSASVALLIHLARNASGHEKFLDALDRLLSLTKGYGAEALEELLRQGGSVWAVGSDRMSLVKRVPDEEVAAFALATEPEGEASDHLQAAWAKIYGRHQDADEAWNQAIKACEAIYIPIVEPDNRRATLGTTLRTLRQHPELFDVRLLHNPSGASVMPQLIEMLDVVWVDPNRHAGQPEPRHATIEDAENIVQLAITLVGWARTVVLTRK